MYIKDPQQQPQACVIWMHGLGADAQDMAGLAEQLALNLPVRHVFLNAPVRPVTLNNHMPMRAWYDLINRDLTGREDKNGILQSKNFIQQVIANQLADGFASNQIFLAGFSQGGAMALFTGICIPEPLAGIIVLSAYLPLVAECKPNQHVESPIFIASGKYDPIVLPTWTQQSAAWLTAQGYQKISMHEYSMEHAVCHEEIADIRRWLIHEISAIHCKGGER
ncbi:phospholipase/carboxylesterase [Legionella longbeachae]|uniref:Phospholipase/carboxylesterase n=1 Tax=Legionella oakridgensis TaxID=29423 RepID=A0A0W0XG71_9GAMM|nr:putative esterase [Legionella oakridgensis RV-2-2007]KTD43580.1 phospholipase/carboxylesterase [Legionella oakridgensis]STY15937.1 phospholipase/carboxylesterase [Legionella longbeachae]